jgi:hypothetical protein
VLQAPLQFQRQKLHEAHRLSHTLQAEVAAAVDRHRHRHPLERAALTCRNAACDL